MNIRDLKYIVMVAELKHFGKAADACFVSQPTLSAQIKKLEEELDLKVFERTNKQVLVTKAGALIVNQARKILQEVAHLKQIAASHDDPYAGQIKLGIFPTLGPYLLPHIIPKLKQALPNLELLLIEQQTEVLLQQLRDGNIDVIILALPIDAEGLHVEPLFKEQFYVALPGQHQLSKRKRVNLTDIEDEQLLLLTDGHCLRDQALEVCHTSKIKQKHGFQATSLETLRYMVASGVGITLLPELATLNKVLSPKQLAIVPFNKPVPKREIAMLWRQGFPQQQSAEKLAEIIKHHSFAH